MAGFSKLFSSIVTSSIWCEDDVTLRVWIAMLATADAQGIVEGSIPGFANLARVSVEQLETALDKLSSPDPYSRTPDNDGRRIEKFDGGWLILNHAKYRAVRDPEERKRQVREAVARHRQKKAPKSKEIKEEKAGNPCKPDVSHGKPQKAHTEAEAEAEAEDRSRGSGEDPDSLEITQEICLDMSHWLGLPMKPTEALRQVVANLLMTGSSKGGVMNGNGGFPPEEIVAAVRGYIVREKTDDYHQRRRKGKSPIPLTWVFRDLERFAEYSEVGRTHFAGWSKKEQERRDRRAQA